MDPSSHAYRPDLSSAELLAELGQLLAEKRQVERLICRYLADLADQIQAGQASVLAGYSDIYQVAYCRLGLGVRATRERVRVGRALRELPAIEQAHLRGELSLSRVRELTRVATPKDEQYWLRQGRELSMRLLEQRVAEAGGAEGPAGQSSEPAKLRWTGPQTVELRLLLPAEAWALVKRAMEGARRASESSLSDAEALEAVAREALARQAEGGEGAEPERTVVLYECRQCGQSELETGAGAVELGAAAAARLGCGAPVRDLATEGRAVQRGGPLPAAVRRAVKLRDRCRCRVPGCTRRRYVDVHHLEPQARGGVHSRSNCLCLCSTHHGLLHDGLLRIEGDAEAELRFFDAQGKLIIDPRCGGPGAVTQCGSSTGTHASLSAEASGVLRAMGRRGGWHPDGLCQASELPVSAVSGGLLELELAGRARRTSYGYEAVT